MAKARKKAEDDAPVDRFGQPLPLVKLVKDGVEVDVREPGALSNLHYGQGFDFVEDGMTYHSALAELLGEEQAREVLVEVPPEGGDVVWPQPGAAVEEDSGAKSGTGKDKKD